jgi:hypothetical protein
MARAPVLAFAVLLIACGESTSPNGAAPDATSEAAQDALADSAPPRIDGGATDGKDGGASDAVSDATAADSGDAGSGDAGECANPDASSCYACWAAAHPGSGFELVFFNQCESCGAPPASCTSTKICDPPTNALPTGACFACLDPVLNATASGWQQCQETSFCSAFVTCIKGCPTQWARTRHLPLGIVREPATLRV